METRTKFDPNRTKSVSKATKIVRKENLIQIDQKIKIASNSAICGLVRIIVVQNGLFCFLMVSYGRQNIDSIVLCCLFSLS